MLLMLIKNVLRFFPLLILACLPTVATATNGYFAHGYGARSKALAGAATAMKLDSLAAAVNPAAMAFIDSRLDLEMELIHLDRQSTVSGPPLPRTGILPLNPGTYENDSEWFPVPTLGWNHRIDPNQTIGLAMYGNGGVNTDYIGKPNSLCGPGGTGLFCTGTFGIDLAQAFISPNYARQFADGRFSLGIAPIFAIQRFKARGFEFLTPFSRDSSRLSGNGYAYAYGGGVRVGLLAEPIRGFRFGASYKSRIFFTRFSEYSGLLADRGAFDIPESFNIGVAWDATTNFTASFDVEHIRYSQIKALGNPILPNLYTAGIGNAASAGLGLKNMTIFKLGLQWQPIPEWTARAGFSYGAQPVPESEVLFNTVTLGTQEVHLTTGFSYKVDQDSELSFAFMFTPEQSVTGPNPLNPSQNIRLEMSQIAFQLAWSRQF